MIMFSVAIAYFIHWNGEGLALQWAFLIVFAFYVLIAALLGVHRLPQGQAGARSRGGDRARRQETKAALTRRTLSR